MKTILLFRALLVLILPLSLLSSTPAPPINNGTTASSSIIPWQVVLKTSSGVICGGSIIGSNTILTAAHCLDGRPITEIYISTASDLNTSHTIDEVFKPANYNSQTYQNDIAVVRLTQPIGSGQAIRYDGSPSIANPGVTATVSGFGSIALNEAPSTNFLLATVPIVNNSSVPNGLLNGYTVTDEMIVAGGEGRGPCQYDSGGPLFLNNSGTNYLVGVVSFRGASNQCAADGVPDAYTRVSSYCPWILQQTVNGIGLDGPTGLCNGQLHPYALTNIPGNVSGPIWSAGAGISINPTTGEAMGNTDFEGTSSITVTFTNDCGSASKTFPITVGTPIEGTYQRDGQTFSLNTVNMVSAAMTPSVATALGASSFNWTLFSANHSPVNWGVNTTATANDRMFLTLSSGQSATFDLSATTNCGNPTRRVTYYVPSGFRVAPNPAKDMFTVEFDHADKLEVLPETLELVGETSTRPVQRVVVSEVFERRGFVGGNKLVFSVGDLPRGTYYLRVLDSRNKETPVQTVRILLI